MSTPPPPAPAPASEPDTLLLLAHGRDDVLTQARFCILTFQHFALREPHRYRVVVYTDSPDRFADLGSTVRTELLTPALLRQWRGRDDYVHRVKPEMFLDYAGKYGGRFAFVDSDTYFMHDPAELFSRIAPGRAVLHLREGALEDRWNANARKLHDFVRRTALPLPDGSMGRLPGNTAMWNSGVVGLAPEDRDLLAPSLALLDELYRRYRKHNMEQLALSYVLATRLELVASDDIVFHYWGRGEAFQEIAERFFADTTTLTLADRAAAAFALAPKPEAKPRRKWYEGVVRRISAAGRGH